ncbi:efflux RND transporter periplasmic adaptor subunit [Anaplasmataceae bacterium AB001_6]|nr:efflux RND transporter periplasmic adaptor subunit [Anaplasmataceae bacterium AB001_6]
MEVGLAVTTIILIVVLMVSEKKHSSNQTKDVELNNVDKKAIETRLNIKLKKIESEIKDISFDLSGTTDVKNKIIIKSKVNGLIEEITSQEGEIVEEGDTIMLIESLDKEEKLNSAKSSLKEKLKSKDIESNLRKEKFSSTMDVYKSESELRIAEQQFKFASIEYEDIKIRSPITGFLEKLNFYKGDYVNIGDEITTIIDTDSYILNVYVPERHIFKIKKGQKAEVVVTRFDKYDGVVDFISKKSTDDTRCYLVEIQIDNRGDIIPTGMSATASIIYDRDLAFYLPASALILDTKGVIGMKYIDVEAEKVKFRKIELISQEGAGYWIKYTEDDILREGSDNLPKALDLIVSGAYYVKDGENISESS